MTTKKGAPVGNRNAAGHHPGTGRHGLLNKVTGGLSGGKNVDVPSLKSAATLGVISGGLVGAASVGMLAAND
jgi:hypothetical protein